MNYQIVTEDDFSSAHALRGYKGKCENLHGHNWKVKVAVSSKELGELGMIMDFGDLKCMLAEVLNELDHKDLSKVSPFDKINPTAENIAAYIFNEMQRELKKIKGLKAVVKEVKVWESETACAIVSK
jgi:6-pyruvoyltetrahydropterin/6-carboxytetrahydropterin synthase